MTVHPEHLPGALIPIDQHAHLGEAARMDIADPLWFLVRQSEMGELAAQDMGSPALAHIEAQSNSFTATRAGQSPPISYDPRLMPLEMRIGRDTSQTLRDWDSRRLALGREVARRLREAGVPAEVRKALRKRFKLPAQVQDPHVAPATHAVALHRNGRGIDGVALLDMMRNAPLLPVLIDAGLDDTDPSGPLAQASLIALLNEEENGLSLGPPTWQDATLDHQADVLAPQGAAPPLRNVIASVQPGPFVLADVNTFHLPDLGPLTDIDLSGLLTDPGSDVAELVGTFNGATATAISHDVLQVSDHAGGPLDWWHFTMQESTSLPAETAARPAPPLSVTAIPTAVSFPGMPLPRIWSIEDPQANYGHLDPAPEDLSRLIVAEFALGGAQSWMLVPFNVLAGSITRLSRMVIRDSFGRETEARPVTAAQDPFRFGLVDGAEDALVVPPVLPRHHKGPVVERVDLIRDAGSNLVWAIEARAPDNVTGLTVDRTEQALAMPQPTQLPRAPTDATMAYRLASPMLSNRFPYEMPPDPFGPRTLVRGVLFNAADGTAPPPSGALLSSQGPINDEAVPPAGIRLERAHCRTRWTNGTVRHWGQQVRKPEKPRAGHAGQRWDQLLPTTGDARQPPPEGGRISVRDVGSYVGTERSLSAIAPDGGSLRDAITRIATARNKSEDSG